MKLRPIFATILLIQSLAIYGEGKPEQTVKTRVSDAHFALGTICTITLYSADTDDVLESAFDIIDDIESKMSINEASSEVASINKMAGIAPVKVSADTFYVIEQSLSYFDAGRGKFDITVQPLVELWGIGTERARIPSKSEIDTAMTLIGSADVVLSQAESTVFLKRAGMAIDLGGIAKGFAADRVRDYLVERDYDRGILNFGGNIIAFGEKPGGAPWIIGIQDPFDTRGTPVATVDLTGESSVVTSGIYERYFERDGRRYHHILDPDTGYPADNELASVTIISKLGIVADVFSTIAFALGITNGAALIENTPSLDAVFTTKSREVYITSGLTECFAMSKSAYILKPLNL